MRNWQDCLFIEGAENVKKHFENMEKMIMFVGVGFDPRACSIPEAINEVNSSFEVCMIDYKDKATIRDDMTNESRSEANYHKLLQLLGELRVKELQVPLYSGKDAKKTLVISESVRGKVTQELIETYENLVVDISAMPRGVSFSIIKRLHDIKTEKQKLLIAVCENSSCDDKIQPQIADGTAEYLPGFGTFSMSLESESDETIWLPVLGMSEKESFKIIANYLEPIEICPVVPFPSADISRGEKILRTNGEILFREWNVEKRNIIYVPEKFPLLVYQKLYDTVSYYQKAFSIDEKRQMKYAFSSQSSKLIDVGVLLAIISLMSEGIKAGIVVVETQGYLLDDYSKEDDELFCLCLDDDEFGW